jgi:hypothetical protein
MLVICVYIDQCREFRVAKKKPTHEWNFKTSYGKYILGCEEQGTNQ